MLADAGTLDTATSCCKRSGCCARKPQVRARLAARFRHVLVDDFQDTSFAQGLLLRLLVAEHGNVCVAGDDDQSIHRFRGASTKSISDFRAEWPDAAVVRLGESRSTASIVAAAQAVVEPDPRPAAQAPGRAPRRTGGGRSRSGAVPTSAQAQAVAADVERLVARADVAPEDVCVLVRSVRAEGPGGRGRARGARRAYRLSGAAAFFQRAEVRDLLAWLRLLVDPGDAGAVVRALARPRSSCARSTSRTQIARQRKLDMVAALGAAMESPQIPPEARERILAFLKLYRSAAGALDSTRPDLYVHRLIERLGLRRLQLLFAASAEVVERLVNLAKFGELAADYLRRAPQATAREFARSIAAVADAGLREEEAVASERPRGVQVMAMHAAKGFEFEHVYVLGLMAARDAGRASAARADPGRADQGGAAARLQGRAHRPDAAADVRRDDARAQRARARLPGGHRARRRAAAVAVRRGGARRHVGGSGRRATRSCSGRPRRSSRRSGCCATSCSTVAQVGGRLGELRFDTDLDVSHAVVRYLEVLKLSALMERTRDGLALRRRGAARGERAAAPGGDRRAARDLRDVRARRVPARRRARREAARAGGRAAPGRRSSSSCRAAATGSC